MRVLDPAVCRVNVAQWHSWERTITSDFNHVTKRQKSFVVRMYGASMACLGSEDVIHRHRSRARPVQHLCVRRFLRPPRTPKTRISRIHSLGMHDIHEVREAHSLHTIAYMGSNDCIPTLGPDISPVWDKIYPWNFLYMLCRGFSLQSCNLFALIPILEFWTEVATIAFWQYCVMITSHF